MAAVAAARVWPLPEVSTARTSLSLDEPGRLLLRPLGVPAGVADVEDELPALSLALVDLVQRDAAWR